MFCVTSVIPVLSETHSGLYCRTALWLSTCSSVVLLSCALCFRAAVSFRQGVLITDEACTVCRPCSGALALLSHRSSQPPFEVGALYYHRCVAEGAEMWEGWVTCSRLHFLIDFGLPLWRLVTFFWLKPHFLLFQSRSSLLLASGKTAMVV